MEEEHYTKNEIDLMHTPMIDKLDEILDQTKLTNGRIGKLERWRAYITGGLAVVIIILLPLLIWTLSQLINVDEKINNGLQKELSKYEVIIE